jgi:hypothetical protein
MKTKFPLFLLAIALVLSCNRCKEECDDPTNPECPNYVAPVDPCANSQEVSANFTISQRAANGGQDVNTFIETDYYVVPSGLVRFYALQENADYKWIIGADTIYSREYDLVFGEAFAGQVIPIKLIISAAPDSFCFPLDNGIDTLIRNIEVRDPADCEISYLGNYYGSWSEAPNDSFFLKLYLLPDSTFPVNDCGELWGKGLNGDYNDSCHLVIGGVTDNYIRIDYDWCPWFTMNEPTGTFLLDVSSNTIHGEYSLILDDDPYIEVDKIFDGRKIE